MEEKKKKDNAFARWTEKHAEFWKFIKFNCAGALSNIPELATQLILVYLVFKCADAPESRETKNCLLLLNFRWICRCICS